MTPVSNDQSIPATLPLMDEFLSRHQRRPLAGWTALLIQHQLGSQVPMTRALLELGIDPGRLYWLDIPYTANQDVYQALRNLGIPGENFAPSYYNLEMKYAAYQHERVQEMALRLSEILRADDRLLVLDDGAYFLEALSCLASTPPGLRIVEQTTRGVIKIAQDAALRARCKTVPTINVAESAPKKELEGPRIGEAVCSRIIERLGSNADALTGDCLILGMGGIGASVADALVRDLAIPPRRIHTLDPSPAAQSASLSKGFRPWDRSVEDRQFRLVIGCSGTTSFSVGDRAFLADGAVLVSASSGSAELSRESFIELADTHPGEDVYVIDRAGLRTRSVHAEIRLHLVDREVVFLNGGFPVNFDGRVNCVPPQYIQATHVLQVGAALEAAATNRPGLSPLSDQLCDWVTERYGALLATTL